MPTGIRLARLAGKPLSARELEVMELIALGDSNDEIAAKLSLSQHTIRTYLKVIFTKLEVDNRVKAARWMWERGMAEKDGL